MEQSYNLLKIDHFSNYYDLYKDGNVYQQNESTAIDYIFSLADNMSSILEYAKYTEIKLKQFSEKEIGISRNNISFPNVGKISGNSAYCYFNGSSNGNFVSYPTIEQSYSGRYAKKGMFFIIDVSNNTDFSGSADIIATSDILDLSTISKTKVSRTSICKTSLSENITSSSGIRQVYPYLTMKSTFAEYGYTVDTSISELKNDYVSISNGSISSDGRIVHSGISDILSASILDIPSLSDISSSYILKSNPIIDSKSSVLEIEERNVISNDESIEILKNDYMITTGLNLVNPTKHTYKAQSEIDIISDSIMSGLSSPSGINMSSFISKHELNLLLNSIKTSIENIKECE